MHLELITPEKVVLREEIDELVVFTPNGQITILQHHTSLMTKVTPGEMVVKIKGKEHYLAVTGGFLEVHNDNISILADYAVRSEDIEVEKVMKAQERAKETLKKKSEGISERDFAVAQAELRKSILQLHVANKRKRVRM